MNIAGNGQPCRWRVALSCALLLTLMACAIDPLAEGACGALLPGDLVLTEIMANPKGTDGDHEWLEVYNAAIQAAPLGGLTLEISRRDGSEVSAFRFGDGQIQAGDYAVVGATAPVSDVVHFSHSGQLGDLVNSGGIVTLRCGNTLIDQALYSEALDGVARALDGGVRPDALLNDRPERWCDASGSFAPEQFGSPGAANLPCGDMGTAPEFCHEVSGATRRLTLPGEGDLVLSEIMANPAASDDGGGEWLEIAVMANVDLNGLTLQVGQKQTVLVAATAACRPATGETWLLLARKSDAGVNGGLPAPDLTAGFSLPNTGGSLSLLLGDTIIDSVAYDEAEVGAAWSLDQSQVDTRANDLAGHWCAATQSYGAGDKGTPGASNPTCPSAPVVYGDGWCQSNGNWRQTLAPSSGDIVITEFMSDPLAVADEKGEWLEILATAAVDLNGLEISRSSGADQVAYAIDNSDCLRLNAGQLALLAASNEASINGGLPTIASELKISLVNDNRDISLSYGGQLIDKVTYGQTQAGVARVLDAGYQSAAANDDAALWCDASSSYGVGDKGTPGLPNPSCGAVPTGYCYANGATRPIAPPAVGDLWISEVMADPQAKGDGDAEWFEIYAKETRDLIGLTISRSNASANKIETTACTQIQVGNFAIFAHSADPALNGQLPPPIALFSLSLPNSGQNMNLSLSANGVTLDSITYTVPGAGKASQLTALADDVGDNDQASAWCAATQSYGEGDKGSPGAANALCP